MAALDVAIVGGGIMGLATARALAARGRRVTLLERFGAFGHPHGSSHGTSRIFRLSHADRAWVELARDAMGAWRELEAERGVTLLELSGALDAGRDLSDNARALEAAGIAYERLDARAAARVGLRLPADEEALLHAEGGIVHAERAALAFADAARAGGAELRAGERVLALEPSGEEVRVHTERGEVRASTVVVAAGPWAQGLLAPLGIPLEAEVTRETVAYFPRAAPRLPVIDWAVPALERFPRAAVGDAVYALPAPGVGLKVGVHRAGPRADPDAPGDPDPGVVAAAAAWIRERLDGEPPGAPLHAETCFYTTTPDAGFVLERHGRVIVGSACSGQGFKFAPVIGRRLADLADEPLA